MLLLLPNLAFETLMDQNPSQIKIDAPITQLLQQWRQGDDAALARLTPVVYDELNRLAAAFMRKERRNHTLRTGDLVHEAFLRLVNERDRDFESRAHFFALSSKVMKDFLIQYARARKAQKRGGGEPVLTLGPADQPMQDAADERIEFLVHSLDALAKLDQRAARALELHYYVGMSVAEIAEVLGVASATVKRDMASGRSWLKTRYREGRV
ncbi:MAG: ECF-type sigma factor [Acidobacteriota bacterium]|nr:ECF-type sigma factor [Acidobacteriota bacterium]